MVDAANYLIYNGLLLRKRLYDDADKLLIS